MLPVPWTGLQATLFYVSEAAVDVDRFHLEVQISAR